MQKKILVVDDDEQILVVWRGALLRYANRWQVQTAQNGCEALDLALHTAFDLIVTDIRMPEMSGCDLTEAIRELNLDVPVIWITGFPSLELEARAAGLDVHCCLTKPVTVAQIRQIVADALGKDLNLDPASSEPKATST